MTDELIGKRVGGYEITEVIGRGGMATVYRAHQVSMNRAVALKVLPRHFADNETYLQRFHREVHIVSQLEHRNIVPVYDYGEFEDQPYIVMRHMAGGSVDDLLKRGAMALARILDIVQQIAPALDYAHGKNVLHRDLKPSNVLLDDGGGAYITDFGIARIASEIQAPAITTQGVVGTPSYMSPEQAQGQPLDNRSDLYSLGVMLFEMATGRRPFESDTPYGIAVKHVTEPPPSPRLINEALGPAIEQVILKALRKRREERYPTAAELAEALQKAVAAPTILLSDTQPGVPRSSLGLDAPPPPDYQPPVHPPIMTPPPPQPQRAMPSSVSMPAVHRPRAKKRGSLLVSTIIGATVGCGLLALLVVLLVLLTQANAREEEQARTATADAQTNQTATNAQSDSEAVFAPTLERDEGDPPLDSTEPSASAVPIDANAPVDASGALVFFARRGGNWDIYRLDLPSRAEQRLTDHPQSDLYAAVSPDGQRIAYQSDRDGDFDIFIMDIDGSNQRRLVQNRVVDRLPYWSPDGEWVVFSSDTRGDGTFDLLRVRPDGTDLQFFVSNGARNSHARWSPDGTSIVFTSGDFDDATTWNIARYDVGSGEITFLTDDDRKDWSPTFRPDGSLLFLTDGEGFGAIAAMTAAGEERELIYDGPGYESEAMSSPDGRFVAFASDTSGQDELYLLVPGGDVVQLTTDGGTYPFWIPQ